MKKISFDVEAKSPNEVIVEASQAISALKRTKRSLSISNCSVTSRSQLLDSALSRQIAVRQADLDSLLPTPTSVIVRSSTPDPGSSCNYQEECLDSTVFRSSNPNLLQQETLHSFNSQSQDQSHLHSPHQGAHLTGGAVGVGTPVICRAPTVPWSPPRKTTFVPAEQSNKSLSIILTEFDPFFDSTSETSAMSSAQAKADCLDKENKFLRLTRRYEPNDFDAETVLENKTTWSKEISSALDNLIDAVESFKLVHGAAVGEAEVKAFDDKVSYGEAAFKNIVNQYTRKSRTVSQINSVASDQSTRSTVQLSSNPSQASVTINTFDIKKAKVNVEVDSERVAKET